MCIYCGTTKYRKIYENHFELIPIDKDGRTYDIHHIDNNHKNNDISNLKAVSIQEHYDIHYSQGDWAACLYISTRMNLSPEKISMLSTNQNNKRVKNRTHPWLSGKSQSETQQRLVKEGKHHWLGGDVQRRQSKKLLQEGKHNFQIENFQRNIQLRLVEEGIHHFQNSEFQRRHANKRVKDGTHPFLGKGDDVSQRNIRRLKDGTHPFLRKDLQRQNNLDRVANGTHPSLIIHICPHCNKQGKGGAMKQWHFDNCKLK